MPHFQRVWAVENNPDQVWFIVPIIGDPMPLAFHANPNVIDAMCDDMNDAIGSDMFVVECLIRESGELNYSYYRDADKMDWIED